MRALPLIPIVVLAGLPVAMRPTAGFLAVAAVAGSLCAAGAFGRWRPLITAGATLTMIQYAFALTGAGSSPVSAAVLGVSLALVLDVSEFVRRFQRATMTAPALSRQVRHWIASVSLGVVAAAALAAVASLVRIGGPPALAPVLAAVGAVMAAVGVGGTVWRRRPESR